MKRLLAATALALAASSSAHAAVVAFDFTTLNGGANNTVLPTSVTVNGITATGYTFSGDVTTIVPLWLRNVAGDHGLGVCSEGAQTCASGGGDVNELDNAGVLEGIRLQNANAGTVWTSLWVSSLDSGGDGGSEEGYLFWGLGLDQRFAFSYGTTAGKCNVECDILALAKQTLSGSAYAALVGSNDITFLPNFDAGTNNDYLVWKGTVSTVPEPSTLGLLGLALLGGVAARRRARN